MLVKPMHSSLVDLKVASRKSKEAQAFRLEEKKKRSDMKKTAKIKKKPTSKHDLCPDFKGDWRQHYGVYVPLPCTANSQPKAF